MIMQAINWKTDSITDITADEYYNLVNRNREHISKTFPITLASCTDPEKTAVFMALLIEKENEKENHFYFLRNLDTNELIGFACIKNINVTLAKCELAYFVDKDFEGRGIITKAVGNTLAVCFNDINMNKVYICTSPFNLASQKIALKHNFRKEGVLRDEFINGEGIMEDVVYFGLLKSDYKNEK